MHAPARAGSVCGMSNLNRRWAAGALAAAAAAGTLAAFAPAAGAQSARRAPDYVHYEYSATVDATIAFDMGDQGGAFSEHARGSVVYRAEFPPAIQFTEQRSFIHSEPATATIRSASASIVFRNPEGAPPHDVDCGASTASLGSELNGILYPVHTFRPGLAPTAMQLMPFSTLRFDLNCSYPNWRKLELGLTSDLGPGSASRNRPLQPVFEVPRADVGSNWIDVPFEYHDTNPDRCPVSGLGYTRCDTMIRGKIRFVRTFMFDDLLAPLIPSKPKVKKQAKGVELRVVCSAGCETEIGVFMRPRRGRGQIYYPGRKGRGRKRSRAIATAAAGSVRPVASWKVRVRAGRDPQTLRVTIPPAARRALLKAGRAHVAVQLDPPSGRTVRRDFAVTVPR